MYLTEEEVVKKGIPGRLRQSFRYAPSMNTSISSMKLAELYTKNIITDNDLKMVKLLYRFSMATVKQLAVLLGLDEKECGGLADRLNSLIQYRVVNRFILVDEHTHNIKVEDDAFVVYTIDYGGALLMGKFSEREECDSWDVGNIVFDTYHPDVMAETSTKVAKKLALIDFYLRLVEEVGDRLVRFECSPLLISKRDRFKPRAMFVIKSHSGSEKTFLLDALFEQELNTMEEKDFREKAGRLDRFISSEAWKHVLNGTRAPGIIILTDSDFAARDAGGILYVTQIESFIMTTTDRIKRKLNSKGAFLKYTEKDNEINLSACVAGIFGPKAPPKEQE